MGSEPKTLQCCFQQGKGSAGSNCLLQRNLLSAVLPVRLVEYRNAYLNNIYLGCVHWHIPYKHLASVYTHLYVVFVYLKLRCLEFLSALSASSVYLNSEVPWGTRWPWWRGVLVYSPFHRSRLQTLVKNEQSSDLSYRFNTQLSPVMSHCLAWILFQGCQCIHTTQTRFLIQGTKFSCVSLLKCQTGWTHSNDEFTPLCSYLYVRVVFGTRNNHQDRNFWCLNTPFGV